MEPQETIYCYDNKKDNCPKRKNCLWIIAVILLTLFAAVISIIIGAALSETILAALSAVIVLAIILGLLFVLTIILILCSNKREKKNKQKCSC